MNLTTANLLIRLGTWVFILVGMPWVLVTRALKNLWTYFFLALLAAWWYTVKGPKPYGFAKLAMWFSELPNELQAGAIAGILTVLGFAIAFWSAHSNWLAQTRINLRLEAADEIYNFFRQASLDMLTVSRSLSLVTDIQQKIHTDKFVLQVDSIETCKLLDRYYPDFIDSLERLVRCQAIVHELRSKHLLVLANTSMGLTSFDNAQSILAGMNELPSVLPHAHPIEQKQLFELAVSPQANIYRSLIAKFSSGSYLVLAGPGGLRGAALQHLFQPSSASIRETSKRLRTMLDEGAPIGKLFASTQIKDRKQVQ
jgi:hypothetical protein